VTSAPYMAFYQGPLTCKTDIPGLEFDFNYGARIKVPAGNWRVKIIDRDSCLTLYDAQVSDTLITSVKKYYVNFRLEIYRDAQLVLAHDLDLSRRKVLLQYPLRRIIGDSIAGFPYGPLFQYLHGCELYCAMDREIADLWQHSYPEIRFVPVDVRPSDIYATYYIGYFFPCSERIYHPVDWRIVGLQSAVAALLGLPLQEVRPLLVPQHRERRIREPYVCIAVQATGQAKYWQHPTGWLQTVAYLQAKGYRVLCIDKEKWQVSGGSGNAIPYGAEDFTGAHPLAERVELLYHADFFVGLGSGLSWLAWAVGIPVVLISGFSLPIAEFYTPYRVINYHVCNGCFSDSRIEFSTQDFSWCPRQAHTERQFECTRFITPEQVQGAIARLMRDYRLFPAGKPGREKEAEAL